MWNVFRLRLRALQERHGLDGYHDGYQNRVTFVMPLQFTAKNMTRYVGI